MPSCPSCESKNVVKNGFIHNGTQNHKCKACGRQFVEAPKQKLIAQATKDLIDKLLLEKMPLAGIAKQCLRCVRNVVAGLCQPQIRVDSSTVQGVF
jgi:transposase-like protein